ncbi:MAG: zinc ABC transporter substrate-binding protein [Spirochaetes bacterium]|nr:zinc ABC transporter substrate-binding protein [Spirochaetota bacterium]
MAYRNLLCRFVLVFALLLLSAAGPRSARANDARLEVSVSIPPQAYFVERIGGERVHVNVLVTPGTSPHTFEPTPRQVASLTGSNIYFGIGLPFEERVVKKIKGRNTSFSFIRTDEGIIRRPLDLPAGRTTDGDDHEEGGLDPHIWLSVPEIRIQSVNIFEALADADPSHLDMYKTNLDRFLAELDAVDAALAEIFKPYRGRPFFVYHPSFGYFADRYGIVQVPIEIEGKSPTPKQIERVIGEAKAKGARVVFVSPQFDAKSAEIIAEAIGGSVVPIDPLAKDVLHNLEKIAAKIRQAFNQP